MPRKMDARLKANLRALEKIVGSRSGLEPVLIAAMLPAQNRVKELAPYMTGTLRRSYHTEVTEPNVVALGTDVEYAPYQEFGTRYMAAQPHLRPAIEQSRSAMAASAAAALEQMVRAKVRITS